MRPISDDIRAYREAVAAALRAIRRHRRLTQLDVADQLGISRRAYQDLEAGASAASLEDLRALARIFACDPIGLVVAAHRGIPSFAVHTAGNKLMSVVVLAVDQFYGEVGPRIEAVYPSPLLSALNGSFAEIAAQISSDDSRSARILELIDPTADTPEDRDDEDEP